MKIVTIGVDCHKKMYHLTAIEEGIIIKRLTVPARPEEVLKAVCSFKNHRTRIAYETGFSGYGLYRFLTGNGIECKVIPPSMVPHMPGEKHKKNDARDSRDLALHYDILPSVSVPTEQEEADRELIRCRQSLIEDCQTQKNRIKKIAGIGILTGMTFLTELFNPERFATSEQVASYLGLTPQEHSSGEKERFGHITRTGNTRLRHMLTESACIWIRKDPRAKAQYEKLKIRRGGKRANIAMARRLGALMWLLITRKEEYRVGA